MRAVWLLILVAVATPLSAQSAAVLPSADGHGGYTSHVPLLDLFALEVGVGSAPMRSAEAFPMLDLPAAVDGSAAAQRWRIHFAPATSPAAAAVFRLVERKTGIAGEIAYSSEHAWSAWQYGLRATRTHALGAHSVALGGTLAVGGVGASVDAERSVIGGDGQVTSGGIRSPSDSVYTFASRTWSGEASSELRWAPTAGGYLFLEVGYRMTRQLGDWRVQMGDVPLELRSATWETAPPMLRTRGAVVRIGFGAFAPGTH
jgi:hypothetical protein